MTIKDITITHFRGFENRSFTFDSKMNVVLGDNTTGKTTLLHAVQIALGSYLQELKLIPHGNGYSRNFNQKDYASKYSESAKDFIVDSSKPCIAVNADFYTSVYDSNLKKLDKNISRIGWKRPSNKNSRTNAGQLMDAVANMEQLRRNSDDTGLISVLPIILSFGGARMETNYNGAEKTKARESRIAKAYKCALDERVDFRSAFDWLYGYDKGLMRGEEFEGTYTAFKTALMSAIPAIKDFQINIKNNEFRALIKMTKDPAPYWLTYDMMSAGFKAMVNVVAEIAYRCIMLNGFLGEDAVKETPGVVMIDELDLYLHPHWQQHVLDDLQHAFPLFQFVVTTHSPFIVQSVDSNNIIRLDGSISNISPSNRGIEEIMAAEMGLDVELENRSEKYRKKYELAHRYYEMVKVGKAGSSEANKVRDELNKLELEASLLHDPAFEAALKLKRGDL